MNEGKVLPYLDIPFQHASPEVLKAMKRPAAQDKTLARIRRWREECPDLALRSTFIVGFPGETDADFAYLLDWLDEAEIDRLGCFKYEPVAGATSNAIENPVPEEIKQERYNALMARQQKISARRLKRKVGTRQQIIIDEVGPTVAKGRSKADAPEIDGAVYLTSRRPLRVGEIVTAKIERADQYDLHGSVAGILRSLCHDRCQQHGRRSQPLPSCERARQQPARVRAFSSLGVSLRQAPFRTPLRASGMTEHRPSPKLQRHRGAVIRFSRTPAARSCAENTSLAANSPFTAAGKPA